MKRLCWWLCLWGALFNLISAADEVASGEYPLAALNAAVGLFASYTCWRFHGDTFPAPPETLT
jgi:hypothetical protein